jgi:hypothetical protein
MGFFVCAEADTCQLKITKSIKTKTFIFYSPCSKTKVASFFGIFTLASLRLCGKIFFSELGFSLAKTPRRKVLNFQPKDRLANTPNLASLRLCKKTFFSGFRFISRQGAKARSIKSST